MTIKEHVSGNQQATFEYYRDGNLWYRTDAGFPFPVPIADAGTATFQAKEKALILMRYIRKHMEFIKEVLQEQAAANT